MKRKLFGGLAAFVFFLFIMIAMSSSQQFQLINETAVIEGTNGYVSEEDYTRVTKMTYEQYSEEDNMLKNISKMTNLEELYLFNASVLEDYSFLSRLPKLKVLFIGDAKGLNSLDFMKNLKSLKRLEITKSNIEDISVLKDNLSISELILWDNQKLTDYRVISTLKSLEILDIKANPKSVVPDTSNLEHLRENNFRFSD